MTILCTKEDNSKTNKQLLVCGPSGAGKTALIKYLLSELGSDLGYCVSVTTREPRNGEINGENYEFVSQKRFEEYIKDNALLEYNQVYQNTYYGTLAQNVEAIEKQGKMPLFDVDANGASKLKSIYGRNMKSIFIMPPSVEELRKRLEQRGTDSVEKIQERVAKAESEMTYKDDFDYILVNDDLDKAKAEILQIVKEYLYECDN
ncbi:MAG: guanylate kinase [Prevotellaceae bacterium]|nr:guanylate kinase [Prevotellaceae bacterium]